MDIVMHHVITKQNNCFAVGYWEGFTSSGRCYSIRGQANGGRVGIQQLIDIHDGQFYCKLIGISFCWCSSRPSVPEDITTGIGDPSPSNQGVLNEKPVGDSTTQELPDIEIMRDAVHDFQMEDVPVWTDQRYDVLEPDTVLEEQIMKDKDASSPFVEEIVVSGGPSIPLPQAEEPQSVASEKAHKNFGLDVDLGECVLQITYCICLLH